MSTRLPSASAPLCAAHSAIAPDVAAVSRVASGAMGLEAERVSVREARLQFAAHRAASEDRSEQQQRIDAFTICRQSLETQELDNHREYDEHNDVGCGETSAM